MTAPEELYSNVAPGPAKPFKTKYHVPDLMWQKAVEEYKLYGPAAAVGYLRDHNIYITKDALKARMKAQGIKSGGVWGENVPGPNFWTPEEVEILLSLWLDPTCPSKSAITQRLGRTWEACKRQLVMRKMYGKRQAIKRGGIIEEDRIVLLPQSKHKQVMVPLIQLDKPLLVIADLHVPYQNAEWVERVSELALAWGVDDVLLAGDALDMYALSTYERESNPTLEDEIEAWREFEDAMLAYYKRLIWMMGNHEYRLGRKIDNAITTAQMVAGVFVDPANREKVEVVNSYSVNVSLPGPDALIDWRIEHPKSAGAGVAVNLAVHHRLNVAVAHTHHASTSRDPSGTYFGVRIGASADHNRMSYCTRITHGKDAMTNGALILVPGKDGIFHYNLEPEMDLRAMKNIYRKAA